MKKFSLPLLLLLFFFATSCEPGNPDDSEPEETESEVEEIINIPDERFKHALVSTSSIDTNDDRVGDSDIDLNNDGEIQISEAEIIEGLIINYDESAVRNNIDITGIENFINLNFLKITGLSNHFTDETTACNFYTYDLTALRKLEYLELNNLATNLIEVLDLSGLTNLTELILISDKPTYNGFTPENIVLPVNFMDVNLDGVNNLISLDIYNSFLNIDFCQVPSLKRLNMRYLEGGEPEIFDFHCLTELEWLDISENRIKSLILKNSSVLNMLDVDDIGASNLGNYPYVENICIDDIPKEYEQIASLRDENTVVTTDCTF